ncbi:carbohydrate ABC transporter substrate-binding protein [Cellulomonas sp. JH27-2]|uniref:ABC transporter substrate-binding protein n=1 Tax=Cellulomonas sp. JH27-2 TaxID=2774139 RepID=UPI00177C49E0|nr:ABC transporter substrate-binding protein [Cellulomonas sp. JH27-2]MBD8059850.1 carbohydrate ABC transporter substrate-binding protein [Cellulomonas sp. JH27-2]
MRSIRRRRAVLGTTALLSVTALLTACGGSDDDATSQDSASAGTPSGSITVLTWRTDLVKDGTFDKYVTAFKAKYPDVKDVKVEGITDYEGEVKTRMSTDDYGDVLAIVGSVKPQQFQQFFEPLGDTAEMSKTYRWLNDKSYEGKAYGIPVVGNVQGIVYNKKVFEQAGITEFPTTPDAFIADLQAIKDKVPGTDPLYTNYKDSWPVSAWEYYRGIPSADPDYVNEMTTWDAPWADGHDHEVIDGLLFDVASKKLIEADPTTTNWEQSKQLLGTGKIGTMLLGSWAIPQMQAAAVAAGNSADDIGYMPFPAQKDGKFHATAGGDYNLAINIHSDNKVTARAWIDWFNNDSGYSESQVGLSPLIDGAVPAALKDFTDQAELITPNPAPAGKESLFSDIDTASGIILTDAGYRKKIIDDARSGKRTKQQVFDDLNKAWAKGRAEAGS